MESATHSLRTDTRPEAARDNALWGCESNGAECESFVDAKNVLRRVLFAGATVARGALQYSADGAQRLQS